MITDALILDLASRYHTPLYVFEEDIVRRQCRALQAAVTYPKKVIRYACKALTLRRILEIVRSEGLWIDAVSINEVHRALRAGFLPEEILYTGEGASEAVYAELLERGILINCSSLYQIELIGRIRPGSRCSIRVNPGEGHGANTKTNTGGPASKHGIYFDQMDQVRAIAKEYRITIAGLHSHIGSGTDITHWLRIKDLTLAVAKHFPDLQFVDLGGGLPIVYNPETDQPIDLQAWGRQLSEGFAQFCREYGRELTLQVEPGRYVVAECGHLIADVQTVKSTPGYTYAVVNSGLNHNPRPAMYGSYHPIRFIAADGTKREKQAEYVIAGYLCESGDVFTVGSDGTLLPRRYPEIRVGDLMVMGHVGAYSHAMKSEYNSMNLPASVLIRSDGTDELIERRGTLEDVTRREVEVYREGR